MLILSGFLGARYASKRPLSLSASLVFEQSYGGVDGDSASSTELYALLSAHLRVPIKQSPRRHRLGQSARRGAGHRRRQREDRGLLRPLRARGLTGEQGVLIPASNVKHLMLRRRRGRGGRSTGSSSVYPVETIDQGIEILTGTVAGSRGPDGAFPEDSVNRLVEQRLIKLAEERRRFASAGKDGEGS